MKQGAQKWGNGETPLILLAITALPWLATTASTYCWGARGAISAYFGGFAAVILLIVGLMLAVWAHGGFTSKELGSVAEAPVAGFTLCAVWLVVGASAVLVGAVLRKISMKLRTR
jgi:hypothetical protein